MNLKDTATEFAESIFGHSAPVAIVAGFVFDYAAQILLGNSIKQTQEILRAKYTNFDTVIDDLRKEAEKG